MSSMEARVTRLEEQVTHLLGGRPGRKPKPIVVSETGVCGIDPERDSTTCGDASLYRFQKGCKGTKCEAINTEYYDTYRREQKAKARKKK
jgi:hypothetical protein